MKLRLYIILAFISFLSASLPGMLFAQVSQGGVPRSFSLVMATDTAGIINIAPPATDILLREDDQDPVPYRFAVNIPVDLGISSSGHWSKAPDGTRVWRLGIKSAGALALTLYFDRFNLPEDGKLFVYNPQRTELLGAFTYLNNNKLSTFATALIHGDQVTIEYDAPEGDTLPEMHISEVAYAYRGIPDYSELKTGFGSSGPCEVNVNCAEGGSWQKEKRSVTRIQIKRGGVNLWCTGSLVNNTMNENTSGCQFFQTMVSTPVMIKPKTSMIERVLLPNKLEAAMILIRTINVTSITATNLFSFFIFF